MRLPEHFVFFWLTLLTLFFSSITAAITSSLTIALSDQYEQYNNISDFKNKKMTAVIATAPYDIARNMGLNIIPAKDREEAFHFLSTGAVSAYVDYYSIANYYINQHQLTNKFTMANVILKRDTFAFALPINSPLLHLFNLKLRSLQDYGLIKSLCERYFGDNRNSVVNCEL